MPDLRQVAGITIGTAGHIDHGKSALVKMITGTDPDRLPEEKERGITIDLGYATVTVGSDRFIGIIDVPGHEKFIRNMVAGASGMGLVILVVAADDGIMPQTREHIDILQLLGVGNGFTVIMKSDLVDEEMRELVTEDVRDYLKGTFLEGKPIIHASSVTREGMGEVMEVIQKAIDLMPISEPTSPFRMPIQRVFSAKGHGTVVTGVPVSGAIRLNDKVDVHPGGLSGRIRRIQAYMSDVDIGRAGHRTALNISDISYKEINRGDVICEPGLYKPADMVEGTLQYLKSPKSGLKTGTVVRFLTGCVETLARCTLLDCDYVEPGGRAFCQLHLENPVVVGPGDRYIIRSESPMSTIGGGVLFGRSRNKLKRNRPPIIELLAKKEAVLKEKARLLEIFMKKEAALGAYPVEVSELPFFIEESHAEIRKMVESLINQGVLIALSGGSLVAHVDSVEAANLRILSLMDEFFRLNPSKHFMPKGNIESKLNLHKDLLEHALERLVSERKIEKNAGQYGFPNRVVELSAQQQSVLDNVEKAYIDSVFSTPSHEELASKLKISGDKVAWAVEFLEEQGKVVRLKGNVFFHTDVIEKGKKMITEHFLQNEKMTASEFKEMAATTRKFAIPILEYYDSLGLTIRRGDDRLPGNIS